MNDKTMASFVIIKPDAIERGLIGQIITRIENMGLSINGTQQRRKSEAWVRAHYSHIDDADILGALCGFMTAVPIIGFVVSGPWAIRRVRNMVGSTDSANATPGTIRGDFGGQPVMYNCVHASETPDDAQREWTLFYDGELDYKEE